MTFQTARWGTTALLALACAMLALPGAYAASVPVAGTTPAPDIAAPDIEQETEPAGLAGQTGQTGVAGADGIGVGDTVTELDETVAELAPLAPPTAPVTDPVTSLVPKLPADLPVGLPGAQGAPAADAASSQGAQPVAPAVAATAAAGAAGVGIGVAALFPGGRRALGAGLRWMLKGLGWAGGLGAVGLFSRIQPDRVLEHETRARILEAVAANPGISLLDLRERIGVAWGTLNHHVHKMQASGHLVSVRQGPRRLLFTAQSPEGRAREELALLHVPTARRIALAVQENPGVRQKDLCESLQLNKPAASKHLARFEAAGLVLVNRDGGACHYQPTPRLEAALQWSTVTPPSLAGLASPGPATAGAASGAPVPVDPVAA